MPAVTPQLVKQLRDRTDQPMGLCKQALDQNDGDMDKAIDYLKSLNSKMQAKREGNETAEGRIGVFFDNAAKTAAIVEMRCESAPSAKSDQFIALAADLAKFVATSKAADVPAVLAEPYGKGTVQDRINDTVGVIREKMILQRFKRLNGGVYGSYIHHDGTVGVLVECKGTATAGNDELLRDVAAHIAALNPPYASPADVPVEQMDKEKAAVKADMDARPEDGFEAREHPRKDHRRQTVEAAVRVRVERTADGERHQVSEDDRRRGPEEGRTGAGPVRPVQGRRRDPVRTSAGARRAPVIHSHHLRDSTDASHTERVEAAPESPRSAGGRTARWRRRSSCQRREIANTLTTVESSKVGDRQRQARRRHHQGEDRPGRGDREDADGHQEDARDTRPRRDEGLHPPEQGRAAEVAVGEEGPRRREVTRFPHDARKPASAGFLHLCRGFAWVNAFACGGSRSRLGWCDRGRKLMTRR